MVEDAQRHRNVVCAYRYGNQFAAKREIHRGICHVALTLADPVLSEPDRVDSVFFLPDPASQHKIVVGITGHGTIGVSALQAAMIFANEYCPRPEAILCSDTVINLQNMAEELKKMTIEEYRELRESILGPEVRVIELVTELLSERRVEEYFCCRPPKPFIPIPKKIGQENTKKQMLRPLWRQKYLI